MRYVCLVSVSTLLTSLHPFKITVFYLFKEDYSRQQMVHGEDHDDDFVCWWRWSITKCFVFKNDHLGIKWQQDEVLCNPVCLSCTTTWAIEYPPKLPSSHSLIAINQTKRIYFRKSKEMFSSKKFSKIAKFNK